MGMDIDFVFKSIAPRIIQSSLWCLEAYGTDLHLNIMVSGSTIDSYILNCNHEFGYFKKY